MSRTPQDALSQRRLVFELRLAIDHALKNDQWGRVDALLLKNPRSCFAPYVTHNIGRRRAVWLSDRARKLSAASLRATHSLA